MNPIVIKPKDQDELKFIASLLQKLGIESIVLNDEIVEDIGLAVMMRGVNRSDIVTEEEVLSKLKD